MEVPPAIPLASPTGSLQWMVLMVFHTTRHCGNFLQQDMSPTVHACTPITLLHARESDLEQEEGVRPK